MEYLGGLGDTDSWKKLVVENLVSDSLEVENLVALSL